MRIGIGNTVPGLSGSHKRGPADFSYGKSDFCDDDNTTYTPTAENPGGTWSISPSLASFNTSTGAFSPYGTTGTFVITHQFDVKTATKTIVLNDADIITSFTYPFSSYPQGNSVVPTPTIAGSGPGINTGTFSVAPAGLSINASTGEIDLTQSSINSYVITYTSGSQSCFDTAQFTLEVENPYVGFKFRIVVPAGEAQTLALETASGAGGSPDSVINWGDGTGVQALTTTTASNSFTTGTYDIEINAFNSTTFVDNFSVTSGETLVTEVIDWGGTPWYSLNNAFEDCTNLTTFGTGTFKGSTSGVGLVEMFKGCTSLTSLDLTNWDLTSGCSIKEIVKDCSNLALVNKPSQPIKITSDSSLAFQNVGNSLTNGCVFNLENLDLSTSTSLNLSSLFEESKIDPSSSFANWSFNSSINTSVREMFKRSSITGTNSTLNISGWNTLNSNVFLEFMSGLNDKVAAASNLTVNLSNLNVSNSVTFKSFFGDGLNNLYKSKVERIIGLNTWPDVTTSSQDLSKMFSGLEYCKLDSDQLSDSFRSSLTPSTMQEMFFGLSRFRTGGDRSLAPVLDNIDLSSASTGAMIYRLFENAKLSSAFSFDNVTFPTTTLVNFSRIFFNLSVDSNDLEIDLSNKTMGISNLSNVGYNLRGATKFYLGDNVDLSSCNNMSSFMFNAGGANSPIDIKLPTNADYGNVTSWNNAFVSFDGVGPSGGLSTCVTDTLIRRLYETSLNANQQLLNIGYSRKTQSPSVVSSNLSDLVSAGWSFSISNEVMPFVYTTPFDAGTTATPTGSFTGGTFSSSNSNIAVDATTGVINTPNAGNTTIRYTLADGCYNEQAIVVNLALAQVNNVYSMEFDGTNDYIDCGGSDVFSFGNATTDSPFSISAWINMDDATRFRIASKFDSSSNGEYIFTVGGSDLLTVNLYDNSESAYIGRKYNTALTSYQGQWIHVVATYDGTSSSSGINLYLNGSEVDDIDNNSGTYLAMENTTQPLNIGRQGASFYANGKIDEVSIFNTALTEAEILSIYNATETGKTADLNDLTTPPIKWYRMGD